MQLLELLHNCSSSYELFHIVIFLKMIRVTNSGKGNKVTRVSR